MDSESTVKALCFLISLTKNIAQVLNQELDKPVSLLLYKSAAQIPHGELFAEHLDDVRVGMMSPMRLATTL